MKWRIAKKIRKAIGTDRDGAYSEQQKQAALNRYDRLKSSREDEAYWDHLMLSMTPVDRATLVGSWSPADSLRILMQEEEGDWDKPYRKILEASK